MSELAYTPATVRRLRELARSKAEGEIAAEFGWAVEFVRKVAHTHAIELIRGAARCCPNCGKPLPAAKPAVPATDSLPLPEKPPRGEVIWSASARELQRDGRALALPAKEAALFDALLAARVSKTAPVRGRQLGDIVGKDYVPKLILASLDQKIVKLGLTVQAHKGPRGGYLLLDLP